MKCDRRIMVYICEPQIKSVESHFPTFSEFFFPSQKSNNNRMILAKAFDIKFDVSFTGDRLIKPWSKNRNNCFQFFSHCYLVYESITRINIIRSLHKGYQSLSRQHNMWNVIPPKSYQNYSQQKIDLEWIKTHVFKCVLSFIK